MRSARRLCLERGVPTSVRVDLSAGGLAARACRAAAPSHGLAFEPCSDRAKKRYNDAKAQYGYGADQTQKAQRHMYTCQDDLSNYLGTTNAKKKVSDSYENRQQVLYAPRGRENKLLTMVEVRHPPSKPDASPRAPPTRAPRRRRPFSRGAPPPPLLTVSVPRCRAEQKQITDCEERLAQAEEDLLEGEEKAPTRTRADKTDGRMTEAHLQMLEALLHMRVLRLLEQKRKRMHTLAELVERDLVPRMTFHDKRVKGKSLSKAPQVPWQAPTAGATLPLCC